MAKGSHLIVVLAAWLAIVLPGCGLAAPRTADESIALAQAIQDLVAAEYALDSAEADYRSAREEGSLGPQEKADFEGFLRSLRQSVNRACGRVDNLGGKLSGHESHCVQARASAPVSAPEGAMTRREQVAAVDAELQAAVADFDKMLLREQMELEASAPNPNAQGGSSGGGGASGGGGGQGQQGQQGAQGGAQGQQGQQGGAQGQQGQQGGGQGQQGMQGIRSAPSMPGEMGSQQGQQGSQGSQGQQGQSGQQGQAGQQGQQGQSGQQGQAGQQGMQGQQGQQGQASAGTGSGRSAQDGNGRRGSIGPPGGGAAAPIPADIPDPQDDDIVAQQLREAAENEPDPELRERLWEEYRRYKESQG